MDPEVWLRGPLPGVPPELMPVAHSLRQIAEELDGIAPSIPAAALWTRPGDAASIGFHLKHLAGSLDRLLTYARGQALSDAQQAALAAETRADDSETAAVLVARAHGAIDRAMAQIASTSVATLDDAREVGRARLPSTVRGLLFHAAEHAQRHAAQIITTTRIVRGTGHVPASPA